MGNTFFDKPQPFQPKASLPPPSPPQASSRIDNSNVNEIEDLVESDDDESEEDLVESDDDESDDVESEEDVVESGDGKPKLCAQLLTIRRIMLGTFRRKKCVFQSRGRCGCKQRLDAIVSTGMSRENILRFHAFDEMGNYLICNKVLRSFGTHKMRSGLRKEIQERVKAISKPGYRIASIDFVRMHDLYEYIIPTPGLGDSYDARLLKLTGNTTSAAFSFLTLKVPDPLNEDGLKNVTLTPVVHKWKSPRLRPKINNRSK